MDFKILLINPTNKRFINQEVTHTPLGLGYLASYLRNKKITVDILDGDFFKIPNKEIFGIIKEKRPDLIGFSPTAFSIQNTYELVNQIKKSNKPPKIVLGGHHATFVAKEILNENKFIDYIVYGEGEITFSELIYRIADNKVINDLKGIFFCNDENEIKRTPPRELISNLDSLPFPARDVFDACKDRGKDFVLNIISSRGCPGNCSFCSVSQFYKNSKGPLWRGRSPKNFVDEIELLINNYGNNLIDISDDNFIGFAKTGKQRIIEIYREIIDRGLKIKFIISCRADLFNENDENLIKLLRKAGLVSVRLGFESGSEKILKLFKKNISVNKLVQTYNLFQKNQVSCAQGNFIMFNPYTTFDDLKESMDLFFELDQILYYELSSILYLFPGISLIDKVRDDNLLKTEFNHFFPLAYNFLNPKIEILANYLFKNRKKFSKIDDVTGKIDSIMNVYDFDFYPLLNSDYKRQYKYKRQLLRELRKDIQNNLKTFIENCIKFLENTNSVNYIDVIEDLDKFKRETIQICEIKTNSIDNLLTEVFKLINTYFQS